MWFMVPFYGCILPIRGLCHIQARGRNMSIYYAYCILCIWFSYACLLCLLYIIYVVIRYTSFVLVGLPLTTRLLQYSTYTLYMYYMLMYYVVLRSIPSLPYVSLLGTNILYKLLPIKFTVVLRVWMWLWVWLWIV